MADPRITITVDYDGDEMSNEDLQRFHDTVEEQGVVIAAADDSNMDIDSFKVDVSQDSSRDDHHQ